MFNVHSNITICKCIGNRHKAQDTLAKLKITHRKLIRKLVVIWWGRQMREFPFYCHVRNIFYFEIRNIRWWILWIVSTGYVWILNINTSQTKHNNERWTIPWAVTQQVSSIQYPLNIEQKYTISIQLHLTNILIYSDCDLNTMWLLFDIVKYILMVCFCLISTFWYSVYCAGSEIKMGFWCAMRNAYWDRKYSRTNVWSLNAVFHWIF